MLNTPLLTDEYLRQDEFGQNWRMQFYDADGNPLSMQSFEQIDFGAVSYKEIFQNVKTILATPLLSAVLERTLGVDWDIVDLPMEKASEATVAILDAIYFWEPRAEVMNINFTTDHLNGHLRPNVQLKIKNVIYGTDKPYDKLSIYAPPPVAPVLPSGEVPPVTGTGEPGPPGAPGAPGQRGSLWFTGTYDPIVTPPTSGPIMSAQAFDMYLNTSNGDIFQFDGSLWRRA